MSEKKYPIGIQNFEKIRTGGYVYVDKTAWIYKLVNTGSYYFLSRPRRFGKSLLISTLEAYLQGKRELFEGLAIEKLETKWTKHPILHLDLNTEKYDTPEALEGVLNAALCEWESLYGSRESERSLALRFQGIIQRACEQTGERVVILVDEYDKPMLQAIGRPDLQEAYRNTLKAFYGALKSRDGYIKFAMLTGVTKFGKVSVFSDLNNLKDISMRNDYAGICGVSEEELLGYFGDSIQELAEANKMSYDNTLAKLRENYNGYHFCEDSIGVYNPFSLLNTFDAKAFRSYWFETGTPTYLVELLKQHHYNLDRLSQEQTTADILNSIDSTSTNPVPVIYQSGYLTIKEYDERFGIYTLGFPNREVEEGFVNFLLPFYTNLTAPETGFAIQKFVRDVEAGNVDGFLSRLQSLLADTSYEQIKRDQEVHYQNVIFIVTKLMGFYVKAEYHTSNGRIDLVLQTDKYVYVMEFKLDGTAEEALQQIRDKHYARPFETDPREVFKIGINFSSDTRNIDRWIVE
ncbi:ATP-binding protein [Odoribacter lunatus]|uniref:ATP-binding protein n=1 Tax=Odoribacter lunatus TaxID=2941335 RepID=UPI00203B972A|nr:ATP-binding protein [Odoribacter lunatus]